MATRHRAIVLPDGCRDVIVKFTPKVAPAVFLTDLDISAYQVELNPGEHLVGVRLVPGANINQRSLFVDTTRDFCPEKAIDRALDAMIMPEDGASEALFLFSSSSCSLVSAARKLGVSERTLRRTVMRATGWPPSRWLALARARRCAYALAFEDHPLAEIAANTGYADQAHMTRDMASWFQMTPRQLRDNATIKPLLSQPGYALNEFVRSSD